MEQLNVNIVKNSTYTLDEIFNIYKEVFPTNKQWSEILTLREGVLNFFSLKNILKKSIAYYDTSKYVKLQCCGIKKHEKKQKKANRSFV